ncbi:DUF6088 family protein [Mesorhizobium sp. B2-6-4]|uniref:DUF6088 family protein n=1 Tax=Mesorhizobium sp. B2-6-4 TaxID=2589913 RepID=UPI001FED7426|nr:DUF6088 family protein [Mesorhizobium sp. B2-6-4]
MDRTLQRLAAAGDLRRIGRGLYDRPRTNTLTGGATVPDYRAVIRAVTPRDNARIVIDGMTAANDLGLTTAVPGRIEVLVDARLRLIKLGGQEIHFKYAAPSRLYWADRPGVRVVQALHWMQDILTQESERKGIATTLRRLLSDPKHGEGIREDLRAGLRQCRSGCRSSCANSSAPPLGQRASHNDRAYRQIIATSPRDRPDLFLVTANHIGAPVGNLEKDLWVCWTLDALYHETAGRRAAAAL